MAHFYLNGTEVDSKGGFGSPSPLRIDGILKNYGSNDIYLGYSPSQPDDSSFKFFKGDIAKIYAWKRALSPDEVKLLHTEIPSEGLTVDLNFAKPNSDFEQFNTELIEEPINIPNSIIPHRVEGKFRCLPHEDEGIVNGKFVKGETTAANERRYVLKMQQGKVNHKEDGIKQLKYELVGEKIFIPWAKMIDIKL